MRSINQKYAITMIATVCTIVFTPYLFAQNTSNYPNMHAASGRSIGEFLTQDGRFDLEAARRAGFQGSFIFNGFEPSIDNATGQPVFRPTKSASTAEHPDDIYWNNSMSLSIPGVNGSGMAFMVYNGKQITGGEFTTAGGKVAPYITSWTKKDSLTDVEQLRLPSIVRLSQNNQNPFNPETTIRYDVPSQSRIILTIYNVLGQPVRTLIDDTQQAGSYRVTWDGTDRYGVPASMGVYFYRLQAGDHSETKKCFY